MKANQEKMHCVFYCGTQRLDWISSNCYRCSKGQHDSKDKCDIKTALDESFWKDGTIPESLALRMGYKEDTIYYLWNCPEIVWNE